MNQLNHRWILQEFKMAYHSFIYTIFYLMNPACNCDLSLWQNFNFCPNKLLFLHFYPDFLTNYILQAFWIMERLFNQSSLWNPCHCFKFFISWILICLFDRRKKTRHWLTPDHCILSVLAIFVICKHHLDCNWHCGIFN